MLLLSVVLSVVKLIVVCIAGILAWNEEKGLINKRNCELKVIKQNKNMLMPFEQIYHH